jgi:hypothetical protein
LLTVTLFANRTKDRSLEQTPFVMEEGKQLFIGWAHQLNEPVYISLEIIGRGEGTARLPPEMNWVAFAVATVQKPNNVNDLALVTVAGPVFVLLS